MEEEAKKLKEEGNVCFREFRYNKAVQLYTTSLEKHLDHVVLGNRGQCYLKLNHFEHAVMDCNKALELNPNFVKGLFRRAVALESLGLYSQARKDLERFLKLSDDQAAKAMLERVANKTNVPSIEIETVEKGDEIRADDILQDVFIECDEIEKEINSSVPIEDSELLPPVPKASPRTYNSFKADYDRLKKFPIILAEYFMEKINTTNYHILFDDVLEVEVISTLLKGLADATQQKSYFATSSSIYKALVLLADVRRFDMLILFLSAEDKKSLHQIAEFIAETDRELFMLKYCLN